MAFKIRNVTIKAVNDSKEVINIVFIVTVTSFVNLMSSIFYGEYIKIRGGLITMILLIIATSVIILTFVPKVWQIILLSMITLYID